MLEQRVTTPSQQKWLSKLQGYDYEICYRSGKENVAADALSRLHCNAATLYALTTLNSELLAAIKELYQIDPKLQQLIQELEDLNSAVSSKYSWMGGLLRRKGKLIVGNDGELRKKLIALFHNDVLGGHSGVLATSKRLAGVVYWKGLQKDVRNFVRQCHTCQLVKYDTSKPAGLLQPLPIPSKVWQEISMDFIEGLPPVQGKSVILVVVDRLSKAAHFIALQHPYTAVTVAQQFMNQVFKLHGMPANIVSDRDPVFTGQFWQELFRIYKVKLKLSTAYHPQTDGQTEVVNRCLENYL